MNRRALTALSTLVMATSLSGFSPGSCGDPIEPDEPVCAVPEGCPSRPPRLLCSALDETDCRARQDCRAVYGQGTCGPTGDCAPSVVFAGCVEARHACPAIACALACAHGLARDATGCDVCACSPVPCVSDSECGPGEACLYPALACPANAFCSPPQGTCGKVDFACDDDTQCSTGEHCVFPKVDCPPNAFCAPPRGSCKPADGCATDADCGPGRACELVANCTAQGCPPLPSPGICRDRLMCTDASQCATGEVCAPDPGNFPAKAVLPATPFYCLPSCEALDEAACGTRTDCLAEYAAPRCGNDPNGPYFTGCKSAVCPAVECLVACANGTVKDANGCDTCTCDESCLSDADCPSGQSCLFLNYDCAAGAECPSVKGVCGAY